MKNIKGFVGYSSMTSNALNAVSAIGELSDIALTYSTDKALYSKSVSDQTDVLNLTVYHSHDSVSNAYQEPTMSESEQIMAVVQSVRTQLQSFPTLTDTQLSSSLSSSFAGRVSTVLFGPRMTQGGNTLPQWMSWTSTEHNNNFVRIWFSDAAFRSQYDEYTIKVVPPIIAVSQFFSGYSNVATLVANENQDVLYQRISDVRAEEPETYMRVFSFSYINPLNQSQMISVKWPLLIYGAAGDNLDSIKDAIQAFLLANAPGTTVTQWTLLFPDLFKKTEFVMMPRWDLVSIPNASLLSALYRNSMNIQDALVYAKTFVGSNFPQAHVDAKLESLAMDYKSIAVLSVPGVNNVTGKTKLTEMYPDFLAVNTSLLDFSRMSVVTQQWLILLNAALLVANNPSNITVLPNGIRFQRKYGKNFTSFMFDNVSYLVATTSN